LVPAYILVVPWRYSDDSPLTEDVSVAMPLLEAVERAAVRAGVPVDAETLVLKPYEQVAA
jgi:hypothetical protein